MSTRAWGPRGAGEGDNGNGTYMFARRADICACIGKVEPAHWKRLCVMIYVRAYWLQLRSAGYTCATRACVRMPASSV